MNCCEGGIHEIRVYYSNSICSTAKASALADELINVLSFIVQNYISDVPSQLRIQIQYLTQEEVFV